MCLIKLVTLFLRTLNLAASSINSGYSFISRYTNTFSYINRIHFVCGRVRLQSLFAMANVRYSFAEIVIAHFIQLFVR